MRTAIISDIHGNLTAFEAVLKDLRETRPDLILHAGDLSDSGASPTEIIDQIRALKWPGVYGNTDELLFRPQSLADFAAALPQLNSMWNAIAEMAAWTREQLGEERLQWLFQLPILHVEQDHFALVHASPADPWRVQLDALKHHPQIVHGHTHLPSIKPGIANTGSVGQPHDGDPRASYLLLTDNVPEIRRVPYDLEKQVKSLRQSTLPHSDWIVRTLQAASPQALRNPTSGSR